jgi:hypothetical protein
MGVEAPVTQLHSGGLTNHITLSNMGTFNNGMPKAKIIVPEFDGSNAREATRWVNKIEQYFRYYQISDDEEKINVASIHMKDFAYDWFLWWREKSKSLARDWVVLKKNFFLHFLDTEEKGVFAKLPDYNSLVQWRNFFRIYMC